MRPVLGLRRLVGARQHTWLATGLGSMGLSKARDQAGETGMTKSGSQKSKSPSQLIDARIKELGDWRGKMLSRLRALVKQADPDVVEEW